MDTTQKQLRAFTDTPALQASISFRERLLLVLAGLFLLVIQSGLIAARQFSPIDYWHFAVWVGCAIAGHLVLHKRVPRRDPFMFPIVMLLTGWGLTVIERTAPGFVSRQTIWLAISVGVMIAILYAPHNLRWLSRYRYLWLVVGLILLMLTVLIGRNPTSIYGPRLWLGIFDAYFQPSELLKVLLVAFLASYLADYQSNLSVRIKIPGIGNFYLPSARFLGPVLLMWGISIVVLALQQDLGTATLFFIIFVTMLYVASGQAIYVIEGAALLLIGGVIGYMVFSVVRLRVDIWLNPWADSGGRAFQIVQSLLAFSAGGIFGAGVTQGSPVYIPVVHSDFIFAAIGEEWGLLGTLAITACIAILVIRGLKVATMIHTRPFRSFLAAGLSITIAAQSLMIMGGVLKLIPLTGVTLPFLSYGGSSLLINFIMVGLLLVLSNEA